MIYLISHFNSRGTGVGQAKIEAVSEAHAREQFAILMPERKISQVVAREG